MSLFRFELRKLLLNKKIMLLLAGLFVLYSAIGFFGAAFLVGGGDSYTVYEELAAEYEGFLDPDKAADAKEVYDELSARYGAGARVIARSIQGQPEAMLKVNYHEFAQTVEEYYNGAPTAAGEEPYGLVLLRAGLAELEKQGKQGTFEYQKLTAALGRLEELGEPRFANTLLWENLFNNWGEHMMQFLLFVPLAFVIAPVFAVERSSGMDNLILSSRHGRRKVVTAKLSAVLVTSAVVVGLYLLSTFLFGFLPHHSLHGWDAAIQSIPSYVRSMFPWKAWQLALAGGAWLIFTGVVFSLITAFVSSRMKSQMGAAGVSLALLFVNVGLAAMGDAVVQRLGPLVDFGLANVTLMKEVFGGYKVFDFLGLRVAYPVMAIIVLVILATVMAVAVYRGQQKRTVA